MGIFSRDIIRKEATILEAKGVEADLTLEVEEAYVNTLKAQSEVVVQEDALKLLEKQYYDSKNRYELGMSAKNEFLQVDVAFQDTKHLLLSAQSSLKKSRAELVRVVGGKIAYNERVEDIPEEEYKDRGLDKLSKIMFAQRSELAVLGKLKKALLRDKSSLQGNYFPKVDLSLKRTIHDKSRGFSGNTTQLKDESTAVVTASWLLYDGGMRETKVAQSIHQGTIIDADIEALRLKLTAQLHTAYEEYKLAKNLKQIAKKALRSAKENYRIVSNLYAQGSLKAITLLDARVDLSKSEQRLNSSYYDAYLAVSRLKRAIEE